MIYLTLRQKKLLGFLIIGLLCFLLLISKLTVDQIASFKDTCRPHTLKYKNHPSQFKHFFSAHTPYPIDLSPWAMKNVKDIRLYSRDNTTPLSAWVIEKGPRWVLLIHGMGNCKQDGHILKNAGILSQHGFSVMMLDLREHGLSNKKTHKHTAGFYESEDVLAAWQWIQDNYQTPAHSIGIYGSSFGAGVSSVSFNKEHKVKALWLDAPYADMKMIANNELKHRGLPTILGALARYGGLLFQGIDLFALAPLKNMESIKDRAVAISYYEHDERIPSSHGKLLCEAAKKWAHHPDRVFCKNIHQGLTLAGKPTSNHGVGPFTDPHWERDLVRFFSQHLN